MSGNGLARRESSISCKNWHVGQLTPDPCHTNNICTYNRPVHSAHSGHFCSLWLWFLGRCFRPPALPVSRNSFFFFLISQLFFFFSFISISWRLITLQCCNGFCHTLTRISHGFTCVPHPESPSCPPPHPIPLGHPSAPAPSTCLMHPTWTA